MTPQPSNLNSEHLHKGKTTEIARLVAVMFTFSFSTAFAATTNAEANLIKQATEYAKSQLAESVQKAIEVTVKNGANSYITEDAWEAAAADIVEKLGAEIDTKAETFLANADAISGNWDAYDVAYAASALYGNGGYDYISLAGFFAQDNWMSVAAAKEQFKIDFAKAIAQYDKIDVDALYSKTTPTAADSYYAKAVKAIADSKEALNDYYLPAGKVNAYFSSVSLLQQGSVEVSSVVANGNATIGATGVGKVEWENTSVAKYYYLKDNTIKMMEQEAAADTLKAAKTAALKATIAQNVANYMTDSTKNAPTGYTKQEWADIYTEIYGYVAEKLPTELENSGKLVYALYEFAPSEVTTRDNAISAVKSLEAYAAKVSAEKNAEGEAVRDAAAVEKLVKAAKLDKYAAAVGVAYAADTNAFDTVYTDIVGLSVSIDGAAAKLAFDKEAKKAALADELDTFEENETYYDLEFAAVKAAYEAAYAKIDAAAKASEFTAIEAALDKEVGKIKDASDVEALFTNVSAMDKELAKQASALVAYVTYKNAPIANKDYEDAYVKGAVDVAAAEVLLTEYYIENGARTAAEMKALSGAVEAVAATLPTTGELEAAAEAAKAAVKAVPAVSKITAADKAVIVAAVEAIEAYEDLCDIADVTPVVYEVDDEIDALRDALQADFNLAYAKADKADKAAMQAIKAEVKAANKELADIFAVPTPAVADIENPAATALNNIKAAEKAAVDKAIAAIPFTVTEADKATVEAARALYDAYVAEYTNVYDAVNGFVADDFDYVTLGRAEAALGLNDNTEERIIASVESLKIKASSTKGKGWIKVQWKVTGDTENVEGYQLYKSTKAQTGYKKCITTTKTSFKNTKNIKAGTRYYYKVRAFVTVDGVKYYSDWSNKANRVAK